MWNILKTDAGETVVAPHSSENKIGGTFGLVLLLVITIAIIWWINSYKTLNSENRLADAVISLKEDVGIVKERSVRNESRAFKNENKLEALANDFNFTKGEYGAEIQCNSQEIGYLRQSRRVKAKQSYSGCGNDELEVVTVFA